MVVPPTFCPDIDKSDRNDKARDTCFVQNYRLTLNPLRIQ